MEKNVNILSVGEIDDKLVGKKVKLTRRSREEVLSKSIEKLQKSGKIEHINLISNFTKSMNLAEGYRNKIVQTAEML